MSRESVRLPSSHIHTDEISLTMKPRFSLHTINLTITKIAYIC